MKSKRKSPNVADVALLHAAETPHPQHPPPDKGFSSSRDRHNDPPVADPKIGNDRVRPDEDP
jgi:hypothetical protein